jgi:hypothetical protein
VPGHAGGSIRSGKYLYVKVLHDHPGYYGTKSPCAPFSREARVISGNLLKGNKSIFWEGRVSEDAGRSTWSLFDGLYYCTVVKRV